MTQFKPPQLSIRNALILCMITVTLLTTFSIIIINTYNFRKSLDSYASRILENTTSHTKYKAESFMHPASYAATLTKILTTNNVLNSNDNTKIEQYFFSQLKTNNQISGIYYANTKGEFIMVSQDKTIDSKYLTKIITEKNNIKTNYYIKRNQNMHITERSREDFDGYDPRKRPWYIKATKAKRLIWTEPYVFFTSQKPGITTASPIYDSNGNLKGIVGVDISLKNLSKFLSQLKISSNSKAFIVNDKNDVIAYPDLDAIVKKTNEKKFALAKIDEINDPIALKAFQTTSNTRENLSTLKPVTVKFEANRTKYYAMFAPLTNQNWTWTICTYMPEDDFLANVKQNNVNSIKIAIAVIFFIFIASFFMARSISKPAKAMRDFAATIRNKDLKTEVKATSFIKEISDTVNDLEKMRQSLVEFEKQIVKKNQQLKQINNSLEEKVEEEAKKLIKQEKIIFEQHKFASMGEIMSALAHQWRQPLNIISLNIQDIEDAYLNDDLNKTYLENCVKSSVDVLNQLSTTIDNFSTFFQSEAVKENFSLMHTLEKAISLYKVQMKSLDITIEPTLTNETTITDEYRIFNENIEIFGEVTEFKKVFLNLIKNAKDSILEKRLHTGHYEGIIKIEIIYNPSQTTVLINVIDNGTGIDDSIINNIFSPYFTTKEEGKGIGVGLYISKVLIENQMGGKLTAKNNTTSGSTFTIELSATRK